MNHTPRISFRTRWAGRVVSPGGFLLSAVLLAGVFLVCHLAGWRQNMSFLCGTPPTGQEEDLPILFGLLYALSYFAAVLIAPVLLLAAGIFALLLKLRREDSLQAQETDK